MGELGPEVWGWLIIGGFFLVAMIGIAVFVTRIYRRVDQGQALIINKPTKTDVTFHGGVVIPVFYRQFMVQKFA